MVVKVCKLEVDFCSVLFYFLCCSVLFGLDCWGGSCLDYAVNFHVPKQ